MFGARGLLEWCGWIICLLLGGCGGGSTLLFVSGVDAAAAIGSHHHHRHRVPLIRRAHSPAEEDVFFETLGTLQSNDFQPWLPPVAVARRNVRNTQYLGRIGVGTPPQFLDIDLTIPMDWRNGVSLLVKNFCVLYHSSKRRFGG